MLKVFLLFLVASTRFHAIYFPSLLLALDLPLPKTILTHSHWTMNKQKMSKSRGNVADPFAAMDLYGVDAIRWYLMRVGGTLDADSGELEKASQTRYSFPLIYTSYHILTLASCFFSSSFFRLLSIHSSGILQEESRRSTRKSAL